jgi:hypothetical protein
MTNPMPCAACKVRPAKSPLALYCTDEECIRHRNRQRQRRHRQRLRAATVAPQPLSPRAPHRIHPIPGLLGWRGNNLMSNATKPGPVTVRWVSPDPRPKERRVLIAAVKKEQLRKRPKKQTAEPDSSPSSVECETTT